jgi:hypothetical protein
MHPQMQAGMDNGTIAMWISTGTFGEAAPAALGLWHPLFLANPADGEAQKEKSKMKLDDDRSKEYFSNN